MRPGFASFGLPTTKAIVVTTVFGLAGLAGFITSRDAEGSLPHMLFGAVLIVNTYFSVRFFSAITPAGNRVQQIVDGCLVVEYLLLACSFGHSGYFLLVGGALFLTAMGKYAHLNRLILYPRTIRRKFIIDMLGLLLFIVGAIIELFNRGVAAWTIAIAFLLANVYLLVINPMYVSRDFVADRPSSSLP